ncbi:MAG: hypothetical protein R3B57_14305 [Phycisphaerales bacterium]
MHGHLNAGRLAGILLVAGVLAPPSLGGEGPFIEVSVSACEFDDQPDVGSVRARWVFDASAPPVSVVPVGLTFNAVEGEAWYSAGVDCDDAFAALTDELPSEGVVQAALFYSIPGQSLLLTLENEDASKSVTLLIASATDAFRADMTSLPNVPAAYQPFEPHESVAINAQSPAFEVLAAWDATTGDDRGRVRVGVRVVDPPESPGCSAADIASPFGVLDFSDVFAFLMAFGGGCP